MEAILVENLVKEYRNGVRALNGLSLSVREGDIFSLLGKNGAGKSTLINILTTFLRPTSGAAEMFGRDVVKNSASIRAEIACVSQKTSIDAYLSLTENMMFQSRLYKIPGNEAKKRMDQLIACFGLEDFLKRPVSSYSGGIKRRLDIALNMMSNPRILFLDEPTVGMDIQSRRAMWEMMKKIREEFHTTIFLTTHYLEEADSLSDSICIIKEGKEVMQGTPAALRRYLRQDMLRIRFADREAAKKNKEKLAGLFGGRAVELREDAVYIPVRNGREDLALASHHMLQSGPDMNFMGIEMMQPSLDDVFIQLTGDTEEKK